MCQQRHSSFRLTSDTAGRKRTDMPSNASEFCARSMSDGRRGTECGSGADFLTETPAGTTSERPGSSSNVPLYAPLESARISDQPAYAAVLPRSAGPDVAEYVATKNASGSMAKFPSQSLPRFCLFTISSARSMLSVCTATLKRAAPLIAWTEILSISHSPYDVRSSLDQFAAITPALKAAGNWVKARRECRDQPRPKVGLYWMCAFPLFAAALSSPSPRFSCFA